MTSIAVQMALYVTWPLWASATCCRGLGFRERLWAHATAAHYRLTRKRALFATEMKNQYSSYVQDTIAGRGHFQVLFKQREKLCILGSDHLAIFEGIVDINTYIINNRAPFHSDTIELLFPSLIPQNIRLKFK